MKLRLFVCLALAVVCAALHNDLSSRHASLDALRDTVAVQGSLSVDLNIANNAKTCKTEKYRTKSLVVRRGSALQFTITGGKPAKLILTLLIRGSKPMDKRGRDTITVPLGGSSNGVSFKNTGGDKHEVTLDVKFPVGEYEVSVEGGGSKGKATQSMYVVFNPYSREDSVFCGSDPKDTKGWRNCNLGEHVEAESGLIWVGSSDNNGPRGWNYDQFNEKALDTVMAAISPLTLAERADPVKVSRRISDIMNTERANDGGILEGNWSGDYSGGKEPWVWTGSIPIFEEFLKTGKATKFGQCWVFAGCTNTLSRALGLPTRVVTNFDSAHECRRNGKFDQIVTEYWKSLPGGKWQREEGKTCDSIWNFHVWNEAFFTRPDIGADYNGWQAFDGTPQEESEGKYQTGPASVKSCHDRKVDLKYDVDFVAGETDADVERYVDGKKYHTDTWHVGAKTYTKAVGSNNFQNVSPAYKTESANRYRFLSAAPADHGLDFKIFVPKSTKRVGEDFYVHLEYKKVGQNTPKKIRLAIVAEAIQYRGKPIATIGEESKEVDVSDTGKVILEIKAAQYLQYLKQSHSFGFAFFASADGATLFIDRAQIDLQVPRLNMLGRVNVRQGSTISIPVKFTNPLKEPLTVNELNYAITGVDVEDDKKTGIFGDPKGFSGVMQPGETKMWHISARASTLGDVLFVATLSTDKLADVFGHKEITVAPSVHYKPGDKAADTTSLA